MATIYGPSTMADVTVRRAASGLSPIVIEGSAGFALYLTTDEATTLATDLLDRIRALDADATRAAVADQELGL